VSRLFEAMGDKPSMAFLLYPPLQGEGKGGDGVTRGS